MQFPADLRYTKDHEWIKVEGNTATIGIFDSVFVLKIAVFSIVFAQV